MRTQTHFHFDMFTVAYPLFFVLLIWVVFWVEVNFGLNFNSFGIQPGNLVGLRGVLLSPFIHSGIKHLYSNSLPLLFLSMALFYFYRGLAWKVLGFGIVLSGIGTWLIGAFGSVHIGASGLIYVLASFLFFQGIWSRYYRLIALSLIIVFGYGSLIWGIFPGMEHISWQGHLSGFISGMLLAFCYRKNTIVPEKKYEWQREDYREEDDEFMQHFDENGNFVPSVGEGDNEVEVGNEVEAEVEAEVDEYAQGKVQIIYEIIEEKETPEDRPSDQEKNN